MIKKSELLEEIKRLSTELSLIKMQVKEILKNIVRWKMKKFFEPTLYKIPIQEPIKIPKLEKMTEKQIEEAVKWVLKH